MILYVKVESDQVEAIVNSLAEFGGELKSDLERIAKDYPGVRIGLKPLPEMEVRKRTALAKDRARYFAPVIGHSGREYERTVLIAFSNGLNHERHLCQVMAAEEPDAGLKKFLLDTQKHYDDLYDRTVALLDKECFGIPTALPQRATANNSISCSRPRNLTPPTLIGEYAGGNSIRCRSSPDISSGRWNSLHASWMRAAVLIVSPK